MMLVRQMNLSLREGGIGVGQDLLSMVCGGRGTTVYADGENGGKQDGKEKDKGHGGDETSKWGDMFAMVE
jgi:hypothetical protein